MDPEGITLSEISQTKKGKQTWYGFNYVWNQKQKNKKVIKSRVLNTENKQEVTDQRGMREEKIDERD